MAQTFDPFGASSSQPDEAADVEPRGVQGWPSLVEPARLVPLPKPKEIIIGSIFIFEDMVF
jgi:hypothetical protein